MEWEYIGKVIEFKTVDGMHYDLLSADFDLITRTYLDKLDGIEYEMLHASYFPQSDIFKTFVNRNMYDIVTIKLEHVENPELLELLIDEYLKHTGYMQTYGYY